MMRMRFIEIYSCVIKGRTTTESFYTKHFGGRVPLPTRVWI